MTTVDAAMIAVIVAMILLSAVYFSWQHRMLRHRLDEAESAVHALASELAAAPIDLTRPVGERNRQLITIEILNPAELAAQQSALAKHLAGFAPTMLRREVTRRAMREVERGLREKGVDAEVRIRDAS